MPKQSDEPDASPSLHVFDQTNGVLGEDDERDEEERGNGKVVTPPSSFGVPPIVSL